MINPREDFAVLAGAILDGGAKSAFIIYNKKLSLKATRRGKPDKRCGQTEILFTIGRLNYAHRKLAKKGDFTNRIFQKFDKKRKAL